MHGTYLEDNVGLGLSSEPIRAYSFLLEIAGADFFGKDVPAMRNEITLEHRGTRESTLANTAGPALLWKASFPAVESGQPSHIAVDGVPAPAALERRAHRQPVVWTVVPVGPEQSRAARYLA